MGNVSTREDGDDEDVEDDMKRLRDVWDLERSMHEGGKPTRQDEPIHAEFSQTERKAVISLKEQVHTIKRQGKKEAEQVVARFMVKTSLRNSACR